MANNVNNGITGVIDIPGALRSRGAADGDQVGGVVAYAGDIYDTIAGKNQATINAEVQQALNTETSVSYNDLTNKPFSVTTSSSGVNIKAGTFDPNTTNHSFAIGAESITLSANNSVALGKGCKSDALEIVLGRYNVQASGCPLIVGCGTSDSNRKNAIVVGPDDKVFINGINGYTGGSVSSIMSTDTSFTTYMTNIGSRIASLENAEITAEDVTYDSSETYSNGTVGNAIQTGITASAASAAAAAQSASTASGYYSDILTAMGNLGSGEAVAAQVALNQADIAGLKSDIVVNLSTRYNTSYANLSAALTALNSDAATDAAAIKKAGVSIKFINSSTNKCEQWNLKASSWSIDTSDWTLDADGSVTNGKLKLPFELEKPSNDTYVTQASEIGYGGGSVKNTLDLTCGKLDSEFGSNKSYDKDILTGAGFVSSHNEDTASTNYSHTRIAVSLGDVVTIKTTVVGAAPTYVLIANNSVIATGATYQSATETTITLTITAGDELAINCHQNGYSTFSITHNHYGNTTSQIEKNTSDINRLLSSLGQPAYSITYDSDDYSDLVWNGTTVTTISGYKGIIVPLIEGNIITVSIATTITLYSSMPENGVNTNYLRTIPKQQAYTVQSTDKYMLITLKVADQPSTTVSVAASGVYAELDATQDEIDSIGAQIPDLSPIEADVAALEQEVFGGTTYKYNKTLVIPNGERIAKFDSSPNLFTNGTKILACLSADANTGGKGSLYGYKGSTPVSLGGFTAIGTEVEITLSDNYDYLQFYESQGTAGFTFYVKIVDSAIVGLRELCTQSTKFNRIIVVDARGGGDYTSFTDAINNAGDSSSNPVTILVMPGVYETDTYQGVLNDGYGDRRYLSIIGTDKNNCIIESHNGAYATFDDNGVTKLDDGAPLKIGGNVYIANLTIRCYDDDTSYRGGTLQYHRSYTIHLDNNVDSGNVLEIHNCNLYNDHWSVIGIGIRPNYEIKITDCDIYCNVDGNEYSNENVGAIYCHAMANHSGGMLSVRRCKIHAIGTKAVRYEHHNTGNAIFEYEFIGNSAKESIVSAISSSLTQSDFCYGNNKDYMNITT